MTTKQGGQEKIALKEYEDYIAAVYRTFYHKNALSIITILDQEGTRQTDLEKRLKLPKSTISRHVNGLLAASLIEREPDTKQLHLSSFGRLLLEDLREYARSLFDSQ